MEISVIPNQSIRSRSGWMMSSRKDLAGFLAADRSKTVFLELVVSRNNLGRFDVIIHRILPPQPGHKVIRSVFDLSADRFALRFVCMKTNWEAKHGCLPPTASRFGVFIPGYGWPSDPTILSRAWGEFRNSKRLSDWSFVWDPQIREFKPQLTRCAGERRENSLIISAM